MGQNGFQKWRGFGWIPPIVGVGQSDAEVFFCSRQSHIESTGILAYVFLVVILDICVKGVEAFGGIKDDDALEFEPFGFVGGGDEEALSGKLLHAGAVA